MRRVRLDLALLATIVVLTACGRVSPTANSSPSTSQSPTATAATLTIPRPTVHAGEVGVVFAPVTVQAEGGNDPFLWTMSDGSMPAGITVSQDGVISGTPTAAGTFTFTLEVTDASMATANVAISITVVPRLAVSLARSGMTATRQGSGASGQFADQAGGFAPFVYALAAGSLPPGTRLDGLSLSGTFSSAGTYSFTVKVTDALGAETSVSASYYVWGPIAFPPLPDLGHLTADQRWNYGDAVCYGSTFSGCSAKFGYTGGTPGVTPTVSYVVQLFGAWAPGPLQGLSVTVANGEVDVSVAPNANLNVDAQWKVWVTLTDPQTGQATSRPAEFVVKFLYYPQPSSTP